MKQDVILGIDPGLGVTGYGVIKKEMNKTFLVDCGYLKLPSSEHLSKRIGIFYETFQKKIAQWEVTKIALETPFLGKNIQSFLKLGYLRGILYLLANTNALELYEFSPREVKQAVTGFGGASKDQVASMVFNLFPQLMNLKVTEKRDVTDALAVTVCGAWRSQI